MPEEEEEEEEEEKLTVHDYACVRAMFTAVQIDS